MNRERFLRFEGGHIGVTGERSAASDWYARHMGLRPLWDGPEEGQTLLAFPKQYAIPLVSVRGGEEVNVWGSDGGESRDSTVRLCFASPDLEGTHALLAFEGVRVGEIRSGPGGDPCFDFHDGEGTRLTAVAVAGGDSESSGDRFSGYAPPRIGVRDLDAAVAWYGEHLGMSPSADRADGAGVRMEMGSGMPVYLEPLPPGSFEGTGAPFARPYFVTLDIEEARRYCEDRGLSPSPVHGRAGALQVFYFHDPDGNRLSIWTYPEAVA